MSKALSGAEEPSALYVNHKKDPVRTWMVRSVLHEEHARVTAVVRDHKAAC